ncbi:MAG: D-alanyl-D-alanine carboxypeptidase [Candidatus Sericytochromatia bacterium]|nr:D-alanyl-D-alanine carboxypeptidase [Candidatus Tanganyikabacteria bacterium]
MRLLSFLLASLLAGALAAPAYAASPASPEISARSALIVDADGRILYERNANKRLPNASTTKVLTALVVIDHSALEDVITVSNAAAKAPPSRLGLVPGERYTVLELLYALLLESANDAAIALAEHVAGSPERFAKVLNQKAKALGAQNTHFVTPNGLHSPGHYSTARDLAVIMRAAMQSPIFVAIAQTQAVDLVWPGNHASHRVDNHNKLLASYATPVLGKTGFTNPAGRCFIGATQDNLLTVVMLGSQNLWRDARRLFDWGIKAKQHTSRGAAGGQS